MQGYRTRMASKAKRRLLEGYRIHLEIGGSDLIRWSTACGS